MSNRFIRIEGVQVDLQADPKAHADVFDHLPDGQREAAYDVLKKETAAYTPEKAKITVENGASVTQVKEEEAAGKATAHADVSKKK